MSDDPTAIPAATIQDVDLSHLPPDTAAEIHRLGRLMELGDESPTEFAQLIRLLHQAGFRAKSEYLLRRNADVIADGRALYRELYGTEKPDEFAAAVEAFADQFSVALELLSDDRFLHRAYRTTAGFTLSDEFHLLSDPCEVSFSYALENVIEAGVFNTAREKYLVLCFLNGVWESADEEGG
jgi:hypothetical protein